ncbi:MAG: FAD-dependent oxidoreductase [Actinobacteria bacterium]|nr:FAD-dependent oxidoreductase [Actinomycetota bacterium]
MTPDDNALRRLSLWWDTLPAELRTADRPPLSGTHDADVAIVGAGYTGLWTAYYLMSADPSLRVVVLEADVAGFGASGRNGGWCSSYFPPSMDALAKASSREGAIAMHRAMNATVLEVGRVAQAEGIDCDWQLGGALQLARSPLQMQRARDDVELMHSWGADEYRLLEQEEARAAVAATDVLGASFTPMVAAIHPARLVRGLALAVESKGATIHEGSRVTSMGPGLVRTAEGEVRARYVVRATEGYTPALPGYERVLAPVYSLMLATEPLPDQVWESIGLRDRQTFGDHQHLIIYGQRTADGRLAFGGRGARYKFGSSIDPHQERSPEIHGAIWSRLVELFPAVADFRVTHTWGGPLGVPRDWFSSVGLDPVTGMGWSGGYVGDGVATANLGGRTLADLILSNDSPITHLPWVNHRSRQWEPEPLRWIGVRAGSWAFTTADAVEARTGKDSRRATFFGRFIGH